MRSILLLGVVFYLAACRTMSPCDFAPSTRGWKPTNAVPQDLVQIAGRVGSWYINDKEQYLACLSNNGSDVCGGNYLVYGKTGSSYTQQDIVVCTAE